MSADNITTCQEAIKYYNLQLSRAEINLANAESRGDVRAVNNIQRKIRIYKFTIDFLGK